MIHLERSLEPFPAARMRSIRFACVCKSLRERKTKTASPLAGVHPLFLPLSKGHLSNSRDQPIRPLLIPDRTEHADAPRCCSLERHSRDKRESKSERRKLVSLACSGNRLKMSASDLQAAAITNRVWDESRCTLTDLRYPRHRTIPVSPASFQRPSPPFPLRSSPNLWMVGKGGGMGGGGGRREQQQQQQQQQQYSPDPGVPPRRTACTRRINPRGPRRGKGGREGGAGFLPRTCSRSKLRLFRRFPGRATNRADVLRSPFLLRPPLVPLDEIRSRSRRQEPNHAGRAIMARSYAGTPREIVPRDPGSTTVPRAFRSSVPSAMMRNARISRGTTRKSIARDAHCFRLRRLFFEYPGNTPGYAVSPPSASLILKSPRE